jgi:GT2 family glycosyltransferase
MELLRTLQQLSYPNWECIVVDNACDNDILATNLFGLENVKYLKSAENLGFAGGNNIGMPLCDGDYVFLINNDTEVPPDFLEPLVEFAESKTNFGALSPLLHYFDEPNKIQFAGSTAMNKVTIRNSGIGIGEMDKGQYDKTYLIPFTHGAAMMVPRSVIEKVGLMRDDYFLYYEELDWCERIRQAGFEIWFCGKSALWHKESVSTGRNSPLKVYYLTRNRILFARRNYGPSTRIINYLYFSLVALPKNVLSFLKNGEVDQAKAFWRGYFYNLTHKSSDSADRY